MRRVKRAPSGRNRRYHSCVRRSFDSIVLVAVSWCLSWGLLAAGPAAAQDAPARSERVVGLEGRPIVVGTRHLPPFVIRNDDGTWTGITIELWEDVAASLGIEYELRDVGTLEAMLGGLSDGSLDAAAAAITVTSDREKVLDFTHAYYSTGLALAVRPERRSGWVGVVEAVFSWPFLRWVLGLSVLIFVFGGVVWFFERRRNDAQFGGSPSKGLGDGFWWSAVTMTTIGYGDKVPVTLGGRMVALVWMFTALIVSSLFTATLTSILTVNKLESRVRGPQDLPDLRAGATAGTSESYMRSQRIPFRLFDSPEEGLQAVAEGNVDAFVYDAPVLRYAVLGRYSDRLVVLPQTFERQDYAIALPEGSVLRERINRVLVEKSRSRSFQDVVFRYLGE